MSGVSRIGDLLRAAIPDARGEQKALAYKAGVTPEALNRILTGATKEPGFETIAKIARAAGLDMNRLAVEEGEVPRASSLAADLLSLSDRRQLVRHAEWLRARFGLEAKAHVIEEDNVLEFVPARTAREVIEESAEFRFPIPPDDFIERDFDFPRDWHYWRDGTRTAEMAAGPTGVVSDFADGEARLLNTRNPTEIIDRLQKIVRVKGDSMEPRYFDGDLVRIDTTRREPTNGEPIAIYITDPANEGGVIGILYRHGDEIELRKKNPDYSPIALGESGWILVGVVVELVSRREAPERIDRTTIDRAAQPRQLGTNSARTKQVTTEGMRDDQRRRDADELRSRRSPDANRDRGDRGTPGDDHERGAERPSLRSDTPEPER
jgi:transcriptional regulator with XRE-family HTH domain